MSLSLGVFVSIIPAQLTKKCPITTSVYCLSISRDMPSLILVKIRILLICIYIYIAYLICQFSTRCLATRPASTSHNKTKQFVHVIKIKILHK